MGVMGGYAPSSIFVEGLGVKLIAKGHPQDSSIYPPRMRLRDEVVKLLQTDPRFSLSIKGLSKTGRRDGWTAWAFKEIQRILKDEGLYMQPMDDSFIMKALYKIIEERSSKDTPIRDRK